MPVVIPCHRVLRTGGGMGGYTGGLERKRFLLELEGARARGERGRGPGGVLLRSAFPGGPGGRWPSRPGRGGGGGARGAPSPAPPVGRTAAGN